MNLQYEHARQIPRLNDTIHVFAQTRPQNAQISGAAADSKFHRIVHRKKPKIFANTSDTVNLKNEHSRRIPILNSQIHPEQMYSQISDTNNRATEHSRKIPILNSQIHPEQMFSQISDTNNRATEHSRQIPVLNSQIHPEQMFSQISDTYNRATEHLRQIPILKDIIQAFAQTHPQNAQISGAASDSTFHRIAQKAKPEVIIANSSETMNQKPEQARQLPKLKDVRYTGEIYAPSTNFLTNSSHEDKEVKLADKLSIGDFFRTNGPLKNFADSLFDLGGLIDSTRGKKIGAVN